MAEEQRWEEGHRLCANDCGFFGSPATMDLCSKCYSDHQRMKEEGQAQAAAAASASWSSSSASSPSSSTSAASAGEGGRDAAAEAAGSSSSAEGGEAAAAASGPRRCASCRKRVGLTGFACRCGATFCGVHRYPERHGCGFDYRAAGRDAIARANPVVKGDKLHHKI